MPSRIAQYNFSFYINSYVHNKGVKMNLLFVLHEQSEMKAAVDFLIMFLSSY